MQVRGILSVKGKVLFTIASDKTLAEAVAIMDEQDVGSLACFEKGRMIGMLTFREIVRELNALGGNWGSIKVADAMVRNPIIGTPDMEVDVLRRLMVERHMRYLPIMEGDTLLGIVSFHDVARAILDEQGFENRMLKAYISDWPQEEART
jgi:CBS domain-containing protein